MIRAIECNSACLDKRLQELQGDGNQIVQVLCINNDMVSVLYETEPSPVYDITDFLDIVDED